MGHGKETPRQKMIGIMYLVLNAMLALNVQREVLDAFANINEGIMKSLENAQARNEVLIAEFDKQAEVNEMKVGPIRDLARQVEERADAIVEKIQGYKHEIIEISEGPDSESIDEDGTVLVDEIGAKDNMDVPAQVMVGDNNQKGGKDVKESMAEFREFLLNDVVSEDNVDLRDAIKHQLHTEDPPVADDGTLLTWESEHFEHLPLAGVVAIMSGLQNDVRNTEADVLNYLYNQIDAGSFKFNRIEATVIPKSNYIFKGNAYQSEIFLSASDSTQDPVVLIGDYDSTLTEEGYYVYNMSGSYDSVSVKQGKAMYEVPTGSLGMKSYSGLIKMQRSDGSWITRPFREEYMVAEPNFGVNPLKMNVFYLGVDNPVNVFVSGVRSDQVTASITNGRMRKSRGDEWIVNPARPGNALIEVATEVEGKKKNMGFVEFRVKEVPNPVAKVGGKQSGAMNKEVLLAQAGIIADMENFDFDLEFKVTEYVATATIRGFLREVPVKSNQFNNEVVNLIQSLARGQRVTFTDVKAVGPDGTVRTLNSINLKLN